MATVYIPAILRPFTGGCTHVDVEGVTVRQVIENLDRQFPGIQDKLVDNNRLRANLSVAVDGEILPLGLMEAVGPSSEVHFVVAIKGG